MRHTALALAAVLLTPALGLADTIYKTDGTSIDDVEVQAETLKEVSYKSGNKRDAVPADKVLRVSYSSKPALVDRADVAIEEDQPESAAEDLETYVGGALSSEKKPRYAWGPGYALHRLIGIYRTAGKFDLTAVTADRLIEKVPDSRYVTEAYLAKAEALSRSGKSQQALAALEQFQSLVKTQNLSKRWALEAELASILYDSALKPGNRRDKLAELSGKSGEFPTVRNHAEVAIGESWLESKDLQKAEKIFQKIADDPKAEGSTLAAAFTGLGDCLFQRAVAAEKGSDARSKLMRDALLSYMRVVVNHRDQSAYVPKAMFFAGRVFDQSEDELSKENAQKLYRSVVRYYDGTQWAAEARSFRKR